MAKKKNRYRDAIYEAYGIQPVNVKGIYNVRTDYYYSQLRKIALSIIDVECSPEWDRDYMREAVLLRGLLCFTEINGTEWALKCDGTGNNAFNRCTTINIANNVLGSFTRTIGKDCQIVYLEQRMGGKFRSVRPILDVYSQKLANCDAAIDINIFNSRTPFIFKAPNQQVADSYKAMFDDIAEGNPAVFIDEQTGLSLGTDEKSSLFMFKAKENFVADVIQNEKMQIMNEFLTTIGINTANTTKRERQIVDEVNANNIEIKANIKVWKDNVEECVRKVNEMFPNVNLKITFPYYTEEEKINDVQTSEQEEGENNDSNRTS